jgi:hexosaminidase
MRKTIYAGLALLLCVLAATPDNAVAQRVASTKTIRTLIITGQDDHHWWEGGSDALRLILAGSGRFAVDVAITPPRGGDMNTFAPDFERYDLVVLNYNGDTWGLKTRKAFESFVKAGGGVVVVHSSISPMPEWIAYNQMTGLGAWGGRNEKSGPWVYWKEGALVRDNTPGEAGFHTLQHPFTVTHRVPEHPILKGLPAEWTHFKDELYAKARGPAENMDVLATAWDDPAGGGSGRHEPVLWTVAWGRGRIFVTTMGHAGNDPALRYSMECAGFQETLLRGAEWAATGAVTRPAPRDMTEAGVATVRPAFRAQPAVVSAARVPVRLLWKPGTMTVVNNSASELAGGWQIWYNGPISRLERPLDSPVQVVSNGSLTRITTTEHYRGLLYGETMDIQLSNSTRFVKNMNAPEGAFLMLPGDEIYPLTVEFDPIPTPDNGREIYERNRDAGRHSADESDLLPMPKSITHTRGAISVSRRVALEYPGLLASEAGFLTEKLTREFGAEVVLASHQGPRNGETLIRLVNNPYLFDQARPEGYKLEIATGHITITAQKAPGMFYGIQSLLNIMKNRRLPSSFSCVEIVDWPDMGFRGQHIDIARNYTSYENMLHLIDIFASYKLNVLHWHFSDDEGWRLEIPGLPELTEIGARRGYTLSETDMLVPAYNGGADPTQGTGSGYVTRAQFIEMLRYAARRHIRVIPEIESPGHARAARVAMNARYLKYIASDPMRATEYLLDDFNDRSVYNSAQDYGDNVMNVAMPSTYRFMEEVIDQIADMYREAGVELETIHIGGDEVPHGAWAGSPVATRFMAVTGIANTTELGEYFIMRVNEILKDRGIKMAGWQELIEGRSEELRAAVRDNLAYVNCWSTNGKQAETPYRLANAGFPVVLSNVGNFYMDLAYSDHPDERGLGWGGYVDDQRAFSMQPYNIYASKRRDDAGAPVDNTRAGEGMVELTAEGARSIIGLQGQLWGETIRNFDGTTYLLFPKMLGMAQRAWNATPQWVGQNGGLESFLADYSHFNAIATRREMPWWAARGLDFRLPPPGIRIDNGMLWANSTIPGAEIRYTTDGSVPTASSTLWTGPVECSAGFVIARLFYLGHESVSTGLSTRR